jgi:hypothetical protein
MESRRFRPEAIVATLLAALVALPGLAAAQREGYTYLSFVGQDVSLVSRADDDAAARLNTPVLGGDSLVTGSGSRAEAVLADGNVVRVDGLTELHFEGMAGTYEADDDRDFLTLVRGTVAIEVREAPVRDLAPRLDTEDATLVATSKGLFRVDSGRRGTEIYVISGKVEVFARSGHALVRSGEYAWVSGDSDIQVDSSRPPHDRFATFLEERHALNGGRDTARTVSADFAYDYDSASLDDYGDWIHVATVNTDCWKPRVPLGWTPYSLGSWRWTPAGLAWVSGEPWGWLPYHYGTWAFDAFAGWCWVPGTAYSPAWVYWDYTPDWVGWCPIGFYGYFDSYYRQSRLVAGGPNPAIYPHLRGRVAVSQIDPRGWSYVPAGRLGARLDPAREIVRGDRMRFRPGEIGVIATAPLRIERGSNPAASIQEALRRISPTEGPVRPVAVSESLTAFLRRERTLTPVIQETLGRTVVRAGQDPLYRPTLAESLLSPRRLDGGSGAGSRPSAVDVPRREVSADAAPRRAERGGSPDAWRERERTAGRGDSQGEGTAKGRSGVASDRGARRGDDGWRSPSSPVPTPFERRPEDRRARHEDSGWRAPLPRVIQRERSHEVDREAPQSPSSAAPAPQPAPASPPAPAAAPAPAPPPAPAPHRN